MGDRVQAVLDRWCAARLGANPRDLALGEVVVVACERRTLREQGYGFIHPVWAWCVRGRTVLSVHPAAREAVAACVSGLGAREVLDSGLWEHLLRDVASLLPQAELAVSRASVMLTHPGGCEPLRHHGLIRPLLPGEPDAWVIERDFMPAAQHPSAGRGEAYGLFLGERLVAEAITHDPPVEAMAGEVAEDGIEVASDHRRQGWGRGLLSYWTWAMQGRGRVCVHTTAASNEASLGLARSVGYELYAEQQGLRQQLDGE